MKIYNSLKEFNPGFKTIVTIGTFDGVHIGHQYIIKYLNDIETLPVNYRTFFSPEKFKLFCSMLNQGLDSSDTNVIADAIRIFSKRLYTSKGTESFKSVESEALVQFIEQNNLI